ncbi:MAG TPA: carboxypeptidase-like regulatory domain-containing protein, partial [Vicinamibacteria bacterium]
MRPSFCRHTIAAVLACLATLGYAQSNTGRISGTVTDTQGGVLPGATVTVSQEGTGLTRTATTDADGAFVFVSLPVGTYSVATELGGFQKLVKSGYNLMADGRLTADFTLAVGEITETVEVT